MYIKIYYFKLLLKWNVFIFTSTFSVVVCNAVSGCIATTFYYFNTYMKNILTAMHNS